MVSKSRSGKIAKIIEKPSIGLQSKSTMQAMQELDSAHDEAIKLCESDWEKSETNKRYLEQRLRISVFKSDNCVDTLDCFLSILEDESFDLDRLRHILISSVLELKANL